MTKSQCYNIISRNNQLIHQYRAEIDTLNREIGELNDTKNKVTSLKSTFSSCKQSSMQRLESTSIVNRINSKIVSKFYNNMSDFFSGLEYQAIAIGLQNGIGKVEEEIRRKRNRIKTLENQIDACQNQIQSMRNTIARIEAEERAAAARAAAARKD